MIIIELWIHNSSQYAYSLCYWEADYSELNFEILIHCEWKPFTVGVNKTMKFLSQTSNKWMFNN